MATNNDFDGVFFTVQALRMYHADVMRESELVIVNNGDPDSPASKELRATAGWWYGQTREAKTREGAGAPHTLGHFQYHELKYPKGTAAPRDMVFRVAQGEFVLCMDCHVLLWEGSLNRLLRGYPNYGDDLITGPLTYYGLETFSTHFDDVWRDQMWGTWNVAWECPDCGMLFSSLQRPEGKMVLTQLMSKHPMASFNRCRCGRMLPSNIDWARHEDALKRAGLKCVAEDMDHQPIEIPAQGLGLFGARRDSWLGFNDKFRGFGGEEWYIHEKYRRAGRRCLCLPYLRWMHRFGYVGTPPYAPRLWDKARNYWIGHHELGIPQDRMRENLSKALPPGDAMFQILDTFDPKDPPEMPPPERITPAKTLPPGMKVANVVPAESWQGTPQVYEEQIVHTTPPPAQQPVPAQPQPQFAGFGPGTEMKKLLHSLGIDPGPNCDCNARASMMDHWGVKGCREHFQEIVGWLKDGQARWGWKEKLAAATKAVTTGLAFKLNPLDPFPGIVEESICRAEKRAKEVLESMPAGDVPLHTMRPVSLSALGYDPAHRPVILGMEHPHSFQLHPFPGGPSTAVWEVGGRYKRLAGAVAIDDRANGGAGPDTPLVFSVLVDGTEVWKSQPAKRPKQIQEFSVGLEGRSQIELRVDCPGSNYCAHAVWVAPRLEVGP
jgi:hypothetical protein